MTSPFLTPSPLTKDGQLAILYVRRDQSIPVILQAEAPAGVDTGYAEGVVTNTRFGSFPHSTLVNIPWGSQVRASVVDTGSRGRKPGVGLSSGSGTRTGKGKGKKRKAEAVEEGHDDDHDGAALDDDVGALDQDGEGQTSPKVQKAAVTADSGFIHILPPTPENWTTSLPHRTQVVYTPDYSYVLHRIRAKPGGVLIEAGSGSGSFTHAAVRAVFNGYPVPSDSKSGGDVNGSSEKPTSSSQQSSTKYGRVFSYEFHALRYAAIIEEMRQHGLDSLVTVTERDVYKDGFILLNPATGDKQSPFANAIFLDLPSPWLALPHLTRASTPESPSPLNPLVAVHICIFIPCIEQAQRTVAALRRHSWVDIEMVNLAHRRIDVRRECTGLKYEGMRSVNAVAATVDESVARLEEVERRGREFHEGQKDRAEGKRRERKEKQVRPPLMDPKTLFKEGRLVHRSEPELKTHTSYLVFAVMPCEWTEEDEMREREKWANPTMGVDYQDEPAKSRRQLKKEAKERTWKAKNKKKKDEDIEEDPEGDDIKSDVIHSGEPPAKEEASEAMVEVVKHSKTGRDDDGMQLDADDV